MIILSAAALVIFVFMAIINIFDCINKKQWFEALLNTFIGVLCISGIGIIYHEFQMDYKVFTGELSR